MCESVDVLHNSVIKAIIFLWIFSSADYSGLFVWNGRAGSVRHRATNRAVNRVRGSGPRAERRQKGQNGNHDCVAPAGGPPIRAVQLPYPGWVNSSQGTGTLSPGPVDDALSP
jgi:hypothetical protein